MDTVPTKRRKLKKHRKEEELRIRLTREQKRVFTEAASRAGLDLSSWLRFVATREVGKVGENT